MKNKESLLPKLTDKITLFATQRATDIIQGIKTSEQLNTDMSRFITVHFERLRQHSIKFGLIDIESLQEQFLKEYQDKFNEIYRDLQLFSKK